MKSINNAEMFLLIFSFIIIFHFSDNEKIVANNHALLFDPASLTVAVGYNASTTIQLVSEQDESVHVSFVYGEDRSQSTDYIKPLEPINFPRHSSHMQIVLQITGLRPGHLIVGCNASPILNASLTERDFLRINIARSTKFDRVINTIGWLSFITWSCSFYPQILLNFRRQSVIGLSFDFLALNILGYFCYSVYNVAFYSWQNVQDSYMKLHPHGIIPVLINDVVFGLHGFIVSFITIFQCLLFEHSKQLVSYTTSILLVIFIVFLFITTILTSVGRIDLLLLIYFYSYVKLIISCIKYIPQVVMNYRRKSTDGWSIGNILLDFLGGILSLIQMFLLAINYNDWLSIFGSVAKFSLGFISIGFDIIFIVQHYILYRNSKQQIDGYQTLDNNEETTTVAVNT
ncbi:unnamed protein product [Rotaria sp. Silwood1]|nr:unnamed protein product [Rotaria sp. Silwood1]CAF0842574.1 unnamed protein product [Rotaria sp. Silwood1]CAF3401232.1 unnamed protein product [Rotaria sp. Silwood1]CAF4856027.1 unnamed protein product [Rotaria sp. Silwood1]